VLASLCTVQILDDEVFGRRNRRDDVDQYAVGILGDEVTLAERLDRRGCACWTLPAGGARSAGRPCQVGLMIRG
jgi:hypothetical protein